MLDYLKLIYYLVKPKSLFLRRFSNALGDNVLLSSLLPEMRAKWPNHKIIVETPLPELFWNNPYVDWVTSKHIKTTQRHIKPKYWVIEGNEPPFTVQMKKHIGLKGRSEPKLFLTEKEKKEAQNRYPFSYITISPAGKTSFSANRKEWGFQNFIKLVNLLEGYRFVQIGMEDDPLLPDVIDARSLSIREMAAVISNSILFIGLEGGLMHLAKSVGTASVIIFGGYIRPTTSGYLNNLNFYSPVFCSPCYSSETASSDCPVMICMKQIHPEKVCRGIGKYLDKISGNNEIKALSSSYSSKMKA